MKTRILATLSAAIGCAASTAQWNLIATSDAPTERQSAGMAYGNGYVLLFGGSTPVPLYPVPMPTGTWRYAGGDWTQLSPALAPSDRASAGLVYDTLRGRFVLFGGSLAVGGVSDQTWEFDGTTWILMSPATRPSARSGHSMWYDSTRHRVVLFGGSPSAGDATWEYDGITWTPVVTTNYPDQNATDPACFDAALGKAVLYGGFPTGDQTWLYDGTDWALVPISGSHPVGRIGAAMVYDPNRQVCVLTGGRLPQGTSVPSLNDTWEFDGTAWTRVLNAFDPDRCYHAMAFDTVRRKVVMYGGKVGDVVGYHWVDDTWEFGATARAFGSGCAGSVGVPALGADEPPRLGETYALQLQNLNPAIGSAAIAFGFLPVAPVALDPYGMLGCTAYVALDVLLPVTAAGGTATWSTTMPSAGSLLGAPLFSQGLSIDPGANPAWLTTSNAIEGTLGR